VAQRCKFAKNVGFDQNVERVGGGGARTGGLGNGQESRPELYLRAAANLQAMGSAPAGQRLLAVAKDNENAEQGMNQSEPPYVGGYGYQGRLN